MPRIWGWFTQFGWRAFQARTEPWHDDIGDEAIKAQYASAVYDVSKHGPWEVMRKGVPRLLCLGVAAMGSPEGKATKTENRGQKQKARSLGRAAGSGSVHRLFRVRHRRRSSWHPQSRS